MESRRRKPSLLRRPPPSLKDPLQSRALGDPSDTTRRKKVKFAESATVLGTTPGHDSPSFQAHKSRSPNFNSPKTFEYKFFKEIWEKTSCHHKNLQFSTEKMDTRASQRNDGMEETNSLITSKHETGSSSLGTGMIIPVANTFSISPVIPVEHEFRISTNSTSSMSMPLTPILDVTPVSRTWNYEPEHENGGIFSVKRKRLLQLVAEAFSLDEDKFELSRLDLIPLLLQRLGIDKELYESKFEEVPEAVKNVSCGQVQSPSFNSYFFDMENTAIATELVASEEIEHLRKDHQSHTWSRDYDDELRRLPWDYNTNLQDFRNWPVVESRLLQKDQCSLELVFKAENSELHDYEMSPPVIEWSSGLKRSNGTGRMFIKPDYKDLSRYLHCLPTNQPKLLNIFDPSSPGEKSTFPLLQWKGLASPNFVFPEMDSSNVFGSSRLHVEMRNRYREDDDIFNSLRSDDREMMPHDAINGCLDIFPPKLEATFGLAWKTLPLDFATGHHLSNRMEVQLYDWDAEGIPTSASARCSSDDIDEEDNLSHRLLV